MQNSTIQDLVLADSNHTEILLALLQEERNALEQRDTPKLDSSNQQKTQVLKQIESNARQRTALLGQAGFSQDKEGLNAYFDSLQNTQAKKIKNDFSRLEIQLGKCQELNNINGVILHRSQQNISRLLHIFRGQTSGSSTYDSTGNKNQYCENQAIAKA